VAAQRNRNLQLVPTENVYTVVPDAEYADMYRVRRPDGSLSDMTNLARANDAARMLADLRGKNRKVLSHVI
jgi:hypothetical protein